MFRFYSIKSSKHNLEIMRKFILLTLYQINRHQLEANGDYRELIQLWKHKKLFNQPPIESVERLIVSNETSFLEKLFNKHLKLNQVNGLTLFDDSKLFMFSNFLENLH